MMKHQTHMAQLQRYMQRGCLSNGHADHRLLAYTYNAVDICLLNQEQGIVPTGMYMVYLWPGLYSCTRAVKPGMGSCT